MKPLSVVPHTCGEPKTRFLVVCAKGGDECYSCGFFKTREEAVWDMWNVQSRCPHCRSYLNIEAVQVPA